MTSPNGCIPPECEWMDCQRQPVGYRRRWSVGKLFMFWFCRPHQRRWDRGVRRKRALLEPEPQYEP